MRGFLGKHRVLGVFLSAIASYAVLVGVILALPANIPPQNFVYVEWVTTGLVVFLVAYFVFYYGVLNRRKKPMLPPFATTAEKKEATLIGIDGDVKGLKATDNKIIGDFDKATMIDVGKDAKVADVEAEGNLIENTNPEAKKARRSTDKEESQ